MPDPGDTLPPITLPFETLNLGEIQQFLLQSVAELADTLRCSHVALVSYAAREKLLRGVAAFPDTWDFTLWRWLCTDVPAIARVIRSEEAHTLSADSVLPPEWDGIQTENAILFPVCFLNRFLGVILVACSDGISLASDEWRKTAQARIDQLAVLMELDRVACAYQDELTLRFSARELTGTVLDGSTPAEIADCLTAIVASRLQESRVALFMRDDFNVWQPLSLRELSAEFGAAAAKLAARSDTLIKLSSPGSPLFLPDVDGQTRIYARAPRVI